jgi:hypothetical protein
MAESRSIQSVFIVVVVTVLAAWLGVAVVTNQSETLIKVAGAALLIIGMFLGKRIWLLMILFVAFKVPLMRGFSTVELGQAMFVGFCVLLFLIRRLKVQTRFGELEVWMLLVAACIAQAYLRNPVGLNIFGGSSVGARPYFVTGLAFVSGWLLSVLVVPATEVRWAMRLTVLGTFFGLPLSEFRTRTGLASIGVEAGGGRVAWLGTSSICLLRWLVSWISPFRALLKPLALLALLVGIAAAAGSGYRNYVSAAGLTLAFGVYYHHGLGSAFIAMMGAAACIGVLAIVNLVAPLPGNMQRALSPFPGTWEERYIQDTENSTEWRLEMWKAALFTDYWIKNKMLGDGLGLTREELQRMESLSAGGGEFGQGASGLTIQQENMMITGSYHSGPVQTVRIVGYVGLTVLMLAMIRLAVHMHRLIKQSRGTEWFPVVFFMVLPNLILPMQFTFVFGEFDAACEFLFFGFGITRLMQNNLPLRQASTVPADPPRLRGEGRIPAFAAARTP